MPLSLSPAYSGKPVRRDAQHPGPDSADFLAHTHSVHAGLCGAHAELETTLKEHRSCDAHQSSGHNSSIVTTSRLMFNHLSSYLLYMPLRYGVMISPRIYPEWHHVGSAAIQDLSRVFRISQGLLRDLRRLSLHGVLRGLSKP